MREFSEKVYFFENRRWSVVRRPADFAAGFFVRAAGGRLAAFCRKRIDKPRGGDVVLRMVRFL